MARNPRKHPNESANSPAQIDLRILVHIVNEKMRATGAPPMVAMQAALHAVTSGLALSYVLEQVDDQIEERLGVISAILDSCRVLNKNLRRQSRIAISLNLTLAASVICSIILTIWRLRG